MSASCDRNNARSGQGYKKEGKELKKDGNLDKEGNFEDRKLHADKCEHIFGEAQ